MFVHDNGNLNVLSMPKCGHAAMIGYFGFETRPDRTFADWLTYTSPKVVVIRHPVERMHSAIRWYDAVFHQRILRYNETGHCDDYDWYLIKPFLNDDWNVERYIFDEHARPYMSLIKNRDFRIIKFEQLMHYIPKLTAHDTRTRNRDLDPFPINRYFNRQDMLRELDVYEDLVTKREVITPEEWKELT